MKRPRPHIPLSVRVQVAERQLSAEDAGTYGRVEWASNKQRLDWLLWAIFGDEPRALDHDPALIVRPFDHQTGKYLPDANDPDYLIYRTTRDHLQKTIGRKSDAEKTVTTKGSDIWLKSKFNRLEGKTKQRPKQKISSRKNPWPKGRKLGRQ